MNFSVISLLSIGWILTSLSTPGYATSIIFSGEIIDIGLHPQPYATIGDLFEIDITIDDDTLAVSNIEINLENYSGTFTPFDMPYGYYNSLIDWQYQTTNTQISFFSTTFHLESDGFSSWITGQVIPTPEPTALLLFTTGIIGIITQRKGRKLSLA